MHNKMIALVALFGLTLFASPALAADDDFTFNFGGKVGWLFLQDEPLSDIVENNWLVGADLTVWMNNGLGFGVDAKFSMKDEDNEDLEDYNFDFEWTQVPVNINAYYRFVEDGQEFVPYVGGGFSMVWTDMTVTVGNVETAQDEFAYGFNGILGVSYGNFFVEGQYIWAETDAYEDIAPLIGAEEDINVGGFNVAIGYRF